MPNCLFKKGFVIGILILFICIGVNPSSGGIGEVHNSLIDNKKKETLDETILVDNDTEYWALLIGVGIYAGKPEEWRPNMIEEVEDLREKFLISEHWNEGNIKTITGFRAFLLNIIRGFRWLDRKEDENDISVVYIATHGGPLNKDLWPKDEWDGKDEVLATFFGFIFPWARIRDDVLNLLLSSLESKGTCVIIDSCYSGGFNDTPYIKTTMNDNKMSADEWMYEFGEDISESGRVVLMSCSEDELSQGTIFTPKLIEGLTGYADVNEDDWVSAEESLEYVRDFCRENWMNVTIFDEYSGELQLTVVEFPPSIPEPPMGQTLGDTNTAYNYTTVSNDPAGDNISYGWDWDGDFVVDEWTDFIASNTTVNTSHSWSVEGTYNIRVKAKDEKGLESEWSDNTVVMMCSDNIPDQWQIERRDGIYLYLNWIAQSFIPSTNSLSKVDLLLSSNADDLPPYILYIRDNLTGDNLAEASRILPDTGNDVTGWPRYAWFSFDFDDIDVTPGKTYYIVSKRMTAGGCTLGYSWADTYPHGRIYNSEDGNNWDTHVGGDSCFVTWAVKT